MDFARAGVETGYEIVGVICTLLDCSTLGGGILVMNLGGWGACIHIYYIGDNPLQMGGMWLQVFQGMMYVLSNPTNKRPFTHLFMICVGAIVLGIVFLHLTYF